MQTPAPNTNVVPSMPTDQGTPPTQQNLQKFLDFLGKAEGADYNVIVGGKKFQDFSRHPGVVGLRTKEGPSTAAGKYQITQTTYNDIAPRLGIKDFSPESQDRIAIELIRQKGAFEDVQKGDFRSAIDKLGATWASLPSSPYTQPKRSWEFAQTALGVPLGTPTQRTQVAARTQKATAGASPTAKKGVQFASLGALPESYRTALALNFIADSDPEDEVISKAIEVLRTTQEDTGAAKTPGGDMLQKYVRGQEGVDPFQFLERKEEPEPRLRRSKMRNLAQGGPVYRQSGSPPQGERAVPSMAEVPVIGPDGRLMLPEEVPERELSISEKLRGALETGATIATGAVAAPIAAFTGLARGKDIKEANVEAGKVLEAMTYQPRSEAGRRYLEAFGKAMQESKLDALLPQAQLLNVRVAPGAAKYLGEQAKGKVEEAVMPGLRERAGDPNLTPEQVYGAMLGKPSEVMAEAGATYATRPLGAYGDVGKDVDIFSRRMENYATDAYLEANDFAENLRSQIDLNSRRLRDAKSELERVAAMSPEEFRQTQAIDPNLNQPVLLRDGEILNLRHRIQELEGQETALQNRYAQESDRAAIFNNFGPQVQQVQQKADDYFSTTFGTVKDPLYKAFMEGRWTPSTIDQLDVVARLPKALRDSLGDQTSLEDVRRLAREGTPGEQEQATIALSNLYDSISQQTAELVSPYTDLGFLMNPEAKKLAVPPLQDYLEDVARSFMDVATDDDVVKALKKDPELIRRAINNQYDDKDLAKRLSDSVISQLDTIDLKETLSALSTFRTARTFVAAKNREKRLQSKEYYERGENPEFSFENVQKAIDEVYLPTLREYYDTQADPTSGKLGTTLDPRSVAMAKTLYHLVGTPEMKKKSLKEIEAELRDYTSSKPGKNPWRYSADTLTPEEIVMRNSRDFVQMVMPDVYTSFYNDVLERQGAKTSAIEISPSQELRNTMAKGEDFDASSVFAAAGSPQSFKSSIDALNAAINADPKYAEAVKRGMPVFKLDSSLLWDADYSPFDMTDIAEYAASLSPTELRNKSFADLVVGSQNIWSNLDNPKTILNRMEKNRSLTPEQKLLGTTRTPYDIPIVNTRDLGNNYGVAGWHQITSPDGVKAEGIMANHCMAQPSYYNQFLDGRSRFYTLRDSMGQPRLTIQMLNERADTEGPPGIPSDQVPGNQFNVVAQIKGNFNNPDAEMYEAEVNDFFRNYMRENNLTSMKFTERDDFLTPALRGEEPL